MPAKPRSDVFDPHEVGVYHCWNRLVQRRFLFGFDSLTGKDYSYRKPWVRDRFRQLAGAMAIDVLDYAVLDNHLHVVLRNRPDIVNTWNDQEVARRWWFVCPLRKNKDGSIPNPKPCELKLLQLEADEYRSRLSDISWFMRLACQPIGRRANQEDHVDGRFFAKRFDCDRLKSTADILSCSIYVDLNAIRAGISRTPEQSTFTSAFDRIRARWQQTQEEMGTSVSIPLTEQADAWLAPIFLDERADALEKSPPSDAVGGSACETESPPAPRRSICNPTRSSWISNKGFLPMTRDQYLSLLDTVGRVIREGKRGAIPAELPPILERLGIDPGRWLDCLSEAFRREPASKLNAPSVAFG